MGKTISPLPKNVPLLPLISVMTLLVAQLRQLVTYLHARLQRTAALCPLTCTGTDSALYLRGFCILMQLDGHVIA